MNNNLQQRFVNGSLPKNLDGFYKGKLEQAIPNSFIEYIADVVTKFWVPWRGKRFNQKEHQGCNSIPPFLTSLTRLLFGEKPIIESDTRHLFAFPFITKVTNGMQDNLKVLQLDYDLPANPPQIRQVVDELVSVGNGEYLGKAYLKEKKGIRLVAFFSLHE